MKILETIAAKFIRGMVNINDMEFGFLPGWGTTDSIFILCQLQERYMAENKMLYFSFIDLEKVFNSVPREVLWWSLRKVSEEK